MPTLPCQPAILAPSVPAARYLAFRLLPDVNPRETLASLASAINGIDTVVGIGSSTLARLGTRIEGLRESPSYDGALEPIPSTPRALWLWLRGEDRGELLHRGIRLTAQLEAAFALESVLDGFRFGAGRDLTDYEDGTENPKGDAASEAALVESDVPGLAGSSFVAVQRWQHELTRFQRFPSEEQDAIIGRRRSDNEELSDAPKSAHVKRTAQESFEPAAFLLRRSLPWIDGHAHGLEFVAFGRSFYAFEAQLRRMVGLEDGIIDGLFRFSRPTATSYYWCPPIANGHLDLRVIGV